MAGVPYFPIFMNDLGFGWHVEEGISTAAFEAVDELCISGNVRAGVLASIVDTVAGGLANVTMGPRIPLTVDLTLHRLSAAAPRHFRMTGRALKVGRSTTVVEVQTDGVDGEQVALSHVTFMASPRPEDVMAEVHWGREPAPHNLHAPILEQIGVRVLAPGHAELDRARYVMQPSGTVQGGAVALLIEAAAESLTGRVVTDLDIRYLSAVRVGPASASAAVVGDGVVRVELRDPGNNDRLATVALARFGAHNASSGGTT